MMMMMSWQLCYDGNDDYDDGTTIVTSWWETVICLWGGAFGSTAEQKIGKHFKGGWVCLWQFVADFTPHHRDYVHQDDDHDHHHDHCDHLRSSLRRAGDKWPAIRRTRCSSHSVFSWASSSGCFIMILMMMMIRMILLMTLIFVSATLSSSRFLMRLLIASPVSGETPTTFSSINESSSPSYQWNFHCPPQHHHQHPHCHHHRAITLSHWVRLGKCRSSGAAVPSRVCIAFGEKDKNHDY